MIGEGISAADLAAGRAAAPSTFHIAAQAPHFPLGQLESRVFEMLAHDLLHAEISNGARYDRVVLLSEGADRGRDVLLYRNRALVGIVQCKRKVSATGIGAIASELLKYCLFANRDPELRPGGDRPFYQLWTSNGVTEDAATFFADRKVSDAYFSTLTRADVEKVAEPYATLRKYDDPGAAQAEAEAAISLARSLDLEHIGAQAIATRLRKHPDVRRAYFRSPEDGPPRAGAKEIGMLMARRRSDDLIAFSDAGAAGENPYVVRASIATALEEFLDQPSRVFALVGGSGQGKSSWTARLIETPPSHWTVDVIRAEEIRPIDDNLVDTLARELLARPMGTIPTADLRQAFWAWLDAENHIIVVDGLDRTLTFAIETLPQWLKRTEQLTRGAPLRLVVTSRRETWSHLVGTLDWTNGSLFGQGNAQTSIELAALSADEASIYYSAYGVDPDQHGGRPLDSPSLIRRFARLKAASKGDIVSRADVLHADFDETLAELGRRPGLSKVAAELLMDRMGTLLFVHEDGWVPVAKLVDGLEGGAPLVDALVGGDYARKQDGRIRLESDDQIEFVMGRMLTPAQAAQHLVFGRADPLMVGAAAIMIARLDRRDTAEAKEALRQMLAGAPHGDSAILDAIARGLLEVRQPQQFLEEIQAAVALWDGFNLALGLSQVGELIRSVALPAAMRLRAIWPLAAFEEPDDWREKYWFDPYMPGRFPTPFADAAEAAATESGEDVIGFLLEMLDAGDPGGHAVATYLLRIASSAAPEIALAKAWQLPRGGEKPPFAIVASSEPTTAVRFLGSAEAATATISERAWLLFGLATHMPIGPRPLPPDAGDVVATARTLLTEATNAIDEVRIIIALLRHGDDETLRRRLVALWPEVPDEHYLTAWRLAGKDREQLLRALISGRDRHHDRGYLLSRLTGTTVDRTILPGILEDMATLAAEDASALVSIALAAETLLYDVAPDEDPSGTLVALAQIIAASSNDDARRALTYYAGSSPRGDTDAAEIARREVLLRHLVEAETGENLAVLLWKIGESFDDRPDPAGHGVRLVDRLSYDAVETAIQARSMLPYMPRLWEAIKARLRERDKGR